MKPIDDETLSRWFDGELGPDKTAEIAERLTDDTALAERVERLERGDALLRDWFDERLEPPAPELENLVRKGIRKRQKTPQVYLWVPAVAAAGVILVAGLVGFDKMIEQRVNSALDQMQAQRASDVATLASAMQDVLETRPSGEAVLVQNASTGFQATLVPKRTWKSASGHWCREFVEIFPGVQVAEAPVSTACRMKDGTWVRLRTEIPSPKAPIILDNPNDGRKGQNL